MLSRLDRVVALVAGYVCPSKMDELTKQLTLILNPSTDPSLCAGFIYLAQIREFAQKSDPVYKIGRTQNVEKRMFMYPKGSVLLLSRPAPDMKCAESELIKIFSATFIHRVDLGKEYFEGDCKKMTKCIDDYLKAPGYTYRPKCTTIIDDVNLALEKNAYDALKEKLTKQSISEHEKNANLGV